MSDISRDSVNRFLERENYEPVDLYNEATQSICLVGGTLSIDDTVLDKPYSHFGRSLLVRQTSQGSEGA